MKNSYLSKSAAILLSALLVNVIVIDDLAKAEDNKFENYEIRVIRPKAFSKRKRFELGIYTGPIIGQTFINTVLLGIDATYHFSEQWGLELNGAYGLSIDKEDKRILKEDFDISTLILRTEFMAGVNLLYAPIYGKYQLTSGKLIYFDTFLSAGAGMTGVRYNYDQCVNPDELDPAARENAPIPPDPKVVTYPSIVLGGGQRYFLSKKDTLKWNVRMNMFSYDVGDGDCRQEPIKTNLNQDIQMTFGYSRYF